MPGQALSYLKNFTKDKYIASMMPTSKFGVQRVCRNINFRHCRLIIEYGPATGVFSRYLLRKMNDRSRLLLIERNPEFVTYLQDHIRDKRVYVAHDSAEEVLSILKNLGLGAADYIISGIPFSFLTPAQREQIIDNSCQALCPRGTFLAYQTFYQKDEHLKTYLQQYFQTVEDQLEIKNIPPLRIYHASK